ncbi:MAG TPA: thrombospondin type 3 repeat-containing protein [bacterium]|nr:thrombospondin type 3 repeat-containing protein [bacterium]
MKHLIPVLCAFLLLWGCSDSNPSEAELLRVAKLEGASVSQQNSLDAATVAAKAILSALGLANASGLELTATSGFDCRAGLGALLDTLFEGSLSVGGDCESLSDEGCSHLFEGRVHFNSLLLGPPGRILSGTHDARLRIDFPGCGAKLDGAALSLSLSGSAIAGDLNLLQVNAAFLVGVDPNGGAVSLTPQFLDALGQFRGLNCRSSLETSVCFVDGDGDLVDDDFDNCRAEANFEQTDSDGDGVGDTCDNCPITPNADQAGGSEDGRGDACLHICAPGLELCGTSDDCPAELLCLGGCCQGECPEAPFASLSCRQADELNEAHGLEGGCGAFSQECNADGCCQLFAFPDPPADFCNDPPELGGLCQGPGGTGFCSAQFGNDICFLFESDPELCPPISDEFPANVDCGPPFGQRVCNDLITVGIGSLELTCNGVCCVEP